MELIHTVIRASSKFSFLLLILPAFSVNAVDDGEKAAMNKLADQFHEGKCSAGRHANYRTMYCRFLSMCVRNEMRHFSASCDANCTQKASKLAAEKCLTREKSGKYFNPDEIPMTTSEAKKYATAIVELRRNLAEKNATASSQSNHPASRPNSGSAYQPSRPAPTYDASKENRELNQYKSCLNSSQLGSCSK